MQYLAPLKMLPQLAQVLLLIATTATASAVPTTVTITHIRGEGTLSCPDEAALKGNVVSRLGYDPFVPAAPVRALTRFTRAGQRFSASLELVREGEAPRTRTLDSESTDCRDVAESLALALTLAIDPQFLVREKPRAVPPAPPPLPVPAVPHASAPVELAVYGGGLVSVGLSPSPTVGGNVGLGFRYRALALYGEGRFDAPASIELAAGVVHTSLLLGTVLPCLQWKHIGACMSLSVGALQVDGRLAFGRRDTSPVVKAGVRLQYEWMLFRHVGLLIHGEVSGVPTRVTVFADDVAIWSTSPVAGNVGLGIIGVL
ncbi:MAG: hypothetical protein K1X64_03930 [Myxococcaceae bacterium]|nr:hypothetical protein [Myxococcaceae bacterium]